MEIGKRHMVIMTADGQFIKAVREGLPQIGEEVAFIPAAANTAVRYRYWYTGAAAAVLLFLIPLILFVQRPHPVVAYLSVDVNPSIELGVDDQQKVRELKAFNDDGQKVIEGISFEGDPVGQVVSDLMNHIVALNYIKTERKDIVITSVLLRDGDNRSDKLENDITSIVNRMVSDSLAKLPANASADVTLLSAPKELREEAAQNGISSGKMAVYLMAKEEGYDIGMEQLKHESIDQVTKEIGGVPAIVAKDSSQASKNGLKQLVEKERKAKTAQASGDNADPKPSAAPAPSQKPAMTQKPAAHSRPSMPQASAPVLAVPRKPASPAEPAPAYTDKGYSDKAQSSHSWQWSESVKPDSPGRIKVTAPVKPDRSQKEDKPKKGRNETEHLRPGIKKLKPNTESGKFGQRGKQAGKNTVQSQQRPYSEKPAGEKNQIGSKWNETSKIWRTNPLFSHAS
ncbi:anti-sigma factor domain-containing protein [Paenibacillus protaetiae]|uniref:Anti-sigma factor domain-containing protein n=1 Tax=Paenibacillus protaetiae TaxID=2509456 RepID=A0A4P6F8C0_9BACL|nr:anti-sigma factor domain-containing protein [Paenibacillus protaetiae]QAY66688.1 anti-sigma factor domain-containing protein [Paenibacillus protaetiae]